jgi:hypothetical protein
MIQVSVTVVTQPSNVPGEAAMHTAHSAKNYALNLVKASVSLIDGKLAAIQLPPHIHKSASPGEIFEMLRDRKPVDGKSVLKQIGAVKADLSRTRQRAAAVLNEARKRGDELLKVAEHIKEGAPLNISDQVLDAAARTVRKGVLSGVLAHDAADEIKRLATAGLLTIAEAEGNLEKIASAGRVAYSKQAELAYSAMAEYDVFTASERRVFRGLAHVAGNARDDRIAAYRATYGGRA